MAQTPYLPFRIYRVTTRDDPASTTREPFEDDRFATERKGEEFISDHLLNDGEPGLDPSRIRYEVGSVEQAQDGVLLDMAKAMWAEDGRAKDHEGDWSEADDATQTLFVSYPRVGRQLLEQARPSIMPIHDTGIQD
jgi:hypothetical protein